MSDPLAAARARAADLQRRIDEAPDEAAASPLADELHELLDDFDNVVELRPDGPR